MRAVNVIQSWFGDVGLGIKNSILGLLSFFFKNIICNGENAHYSNWLRGNADKGV